MTQLSEADLPGRSATPAPAEWAPSPTRRIVSTVLLLLAPLIGLSIAGAGALAASGSVAAHGRFIVSGAPIELAAGTSYTVYLPKGTPGECTVNHGFTGVRTEPSNAFRSTVQSRPFRANVDFVPPRSGTYSISCAGVTDRSSVLLAPGARTADAQVPLATGITIFLTAVVAGGLVLDRRLERRRR